MTTDNRTTRDLNLDVSGVPERHGYHESGSQHTALAGQVIRDAARICDGTRDHPSRPAVSQAPSPPAPPGTPDPEPGPGPDIPDDDLAAVTLTHAEVRTVLTSLDLAAARQRDRADRCAHCQDQSCLACQLRRRDARTDDQMARQVLQDEQATRNARGQPGPSGSPAPTSQPRPAAGMEAGQ
jgi:hypothetical protein